MLGARSSIATIAVENLEVARAYYEGKLGLEVARELPEDGNILSVVNELME